MTHEETIFAEALGKGSAPARDAYLNEACAGNAALRQAVEALLLAHQKAGGILEAPPVGLEMTIEPRPSSESVGATIGPYKLLQEIGEGGMAVVFLAEQSRPIQRKVALKIIKPGMDSRQVIARFEAERQALAVMDHPNIAKVLEAGTTGSGRPYFVMELVKGIPITRYCDEHHLTPRQRLELFVQVCSAVQHAHTKGIIHRDLKPSNVLVALYDGKPVPKVIDFGIAKATGQPLTERTLFTGFGSVVGTPEYMSPEQAELNQLDVDTRCDIYSLGVLLYELLTGSTPLEHNRFKAAALLEMLRVVREEEPPKPSTRLSTTEQLPSIAANRGLEPKKLSALVHGELDWIVMKALEKDRSRRYETANGFAMDVQRYLDDEAVQACPPTAGYRLRKLARKYRAALRVAAAFMLLLIAATVVSTWQAVRATRAKAAAVAQTKRADQQATRSQQVARFLEDMLQGVGPSVALGRDTTMLREIVDRTAQRIKIDLKDQPDVQIELDLTLTEVYSQLQEPKKMEQTARQTVALARGHIGAESLPAADALGKLGIALIELRSLEEAETVTRQAIAIQRKLRGGDSVQEGKALCSLGDVLRLQANRTRPPVSEGKLSEAESANQSGLAILRKHLGNDNDEVSRALCLLSFTLLAVDKQAESEAAIRESLAIRQRLHGDEYPSMQYGFMSYVLLVRGKLDEAEACARKALDVQRKMGLTGKLTQVNTYFNLGNILLAKGKPDEAETHFREGLRIGRKEMGSEYRDLPHWLSMLAKTLRTNGKLAEARPLAEEALAICDRHPDQVESWARDEAFFTLQDVLRGLGDTAALEALATQLINRAELTGNVDQLATAYAEAIPLLMSGGQQEQARDLCRKLLALMPQKNRAANGAAWFLATAANPVNRDPAMAVELAKKAVELSPQSGGIWNTLGVARYRAGEFKQAVADLEKSTQLGKGGSSDDFFFLAMAHWQLGEKDQARKWYDQAVQWMQKNKPQNEELGRFRMEAAELLKITDEKPTTSPESK